MKGGVLLVFLVTLSITWAVHFAPRRGSRSQFTQFARQQEVPHTVYGPPPEQPQATYGPPPAAEPQPSYGPPQEPATTATPEETTTEQPTTTEPATTEQPQSERLQDNSKAGGVYYIFHPNGQLQKVVFATREDTKNMAFSAKLKYRNVAPITEPIFTYDPKTSVLRRLEI